MGEENNKLKMLYLEKSILSTIIYYNNIGQPLTVFEIYKYLIKPKDGCGNGAEGLVKNDYSFSNIVNCLDKSVCLKKIINCEKGFYFLYEKEKHDYSLHLQRTIKHRVAIKKWKKAKKIIKFLQVVPFVKMIAVSGSLAMNNTRQDSDIDLLIVTKSRRIWLARFFVTLLTHILGVRRQKNLTANRICLNHYITDESLKIPFKSLYNAQSYSRLVIVYQSEKDIYDKFQKANSWVGDCLFNYHKNSNNLHTIKGDKILRNIAGFLDTALGGFLGDFLEKIIGNYQSRHISKDPLTTKKGGRVTFNDEQLEFHPDSPELKTIDSFNKTTFDLGLLEYTNQEDSGLTR